MKKKNITSIEEFKTLNESSSYDIQFTDSKKDIIDLLLSLNNNKDFTIKQLDGDNFEIACRCKHRMKHLVYGLY